MKKTLIASLPLVSCVTAVGLQRNTMTLAADDPARDHYNNGECAYCKLNWFSELDYPKEEEVDHRQACALPPEMQKQCALGQCMLDLDSFSYDDYAGCVLNWDDEEDEEDEESSEEDDSERGVLQSSESSSEDEDDRLSDSERE